MKLPVYVSRTLSKHFGKPIGRGTFSRVCRKENSDQVTVVSNDQVKDCMAFFNEEFSSPLFPSISPYLNSETENLLNTLDERFGFLRVYKMPFYERTISLKRSLKPDQWKLYKALRALSNYVFSVETNCNYLIDLFNLHLSSEYPEIAKSLETAINTLASFGYDLRFEISPRNVRVSREGQLILLNCFFFKSALL